jgi:hypothetical protein
MSSVTRFLTQVNSSATVFSAGNTTLASATAAYEFIPASGNTVGNYPPGYVQLLPSSVSALLNSNATGAVLRDMGKTIYANVYAAGVATAAWGRFRQVQLLVPSVGNNNFIGGTTGSTSGVIGGPAIGDVYTNYMTFYIPIVSNGIVPAATLTTAPAVLAGTNQM